jgi:hypothetical protein
VLDVPLLLVRPRPFSIEKGLSVFYTSGPDKRDKCVNEIILCCPENRDKYVHEFILKTAEKFLTY